MANTFFDPHQRATIEAAMARDHPDRRQPGAREAGCIDFLDRYLSGIGFIFAKPDGSGFETLEGRPAEAWMRRIEIMRGTYLEGIAELDERGARRFRCRVHRSSGPAQQDEVLKEVEKRAPAQQPTRAPRRNLGESEPTDRRCSRRRPRSTSTSSRC